MFGFQCSGNLDPAMHITLLSNALRNIRAKGRVFLNSWSWSVTRHLPGAASECSGRKHFVCRAAASETDRKIAPPREARLVFARKATRVCTCVPEGCFAGEDGVILRSVSEQNACCRILASSALLSNLINLISQREIRGATEH